METFKLSQCWLITDWKPECEYSYFQPNAISPMWCQWQGQYFLLSFRTSQLIIRGLYSALSMCRWPRNGNELLWHQLLQPKEWSTNQYPVRFRVGSFRQKTDALGNIATQRKKCSQNDGSRSCSIFGYFKRTNS